jgi:hypothetical protein
MTNKIMNIWEQIAKKHPTITIQRLARDSVRVTVTREGITKHFFGDDEPSARLKADLYLAEIGYTDK